MSPRRRAPRSGGVLAALLAACAGDGGDGGPGDAAPIVDAAPEPPGTCPAGGGGLACLFDLHDRAVADCEAAAVDAFIASIALRHGDLPAWHDGRALFVSRGAAAAVAGDFDDWRTDAVVTRRLCATSLFVASAVVAAGRHRYKLVAGGDWQLDPENFAFAYDDFAGNPDGENSVLNTYDSGLGHLVRLGEPLCSDALGDCRDLTAYLPPGYGDPAAAGRTYPTLFLHDGQNVFDDHGCCNGHAGWEINVALDAGIAAGSIAPIVVVAADHAGERRNAEYGFEAREAFMDFQVHQLQPRAAATWRLDGSRLYVGGSSLGGLVSLLLAVTYPDTYAGVASLSGSFWVEAGTARAAEAIVRAAGKRPLAIYLDHGGTAAGGEDNYASNQAMRDTLVDLGWVAAAPPDCRADEDALCYVVDEGAGHDELAWRARAPAMLRLLFAP